MFRFHIRQLRPRLLSGWIWRRLRRLRRPEGDRRGPLILCAQRDSEGTAEHAEHAEYHQDMSAASALWMALSSSLLQVRLAESSVSVRRSRTSVALSPTAPAVECSSSCESRIMRLSSVMSFSVFASMVLMVGLSLKVLNLGVHVGVDWHGISFALKQAQRCAVFGQHFSVLGFNSIDRVFYFSMVRCRIAA